MRSFPHPLADPVRSRHAVGRRYAIAIACLVSLLALLGVASRASALNYVYNSDQSFWAVEDAATPGLDTGSIKSTTSEKFGVFTLYTGVLQGYGGIRMQVTGAPAEPRMNGVLMRGFGLAYDGGNEFTSRNAVSLGGVAVTRSLMIDKTKKYARFLDTFTNETASPLSVDVDFGGQVGYNSGNHQSALFATSSGDTAVTPADSWVAVKTPSVVGNLASPSAYGSAATVLGTAGSSFTRTSDFLVEPFTRPLQTSGDQANHHGFINHLTLGRGETRTLVHFVVTGLSETRNTPSGGPIPASGSETSAVTAQAAALATTPDFSGIGTGRLCSLANWNTASIQAYDPGFDSAECATAEEINIPAPVSEPQATTSSPYDVVGKTITQELADMKDGTTNSAQIVKAYLDRIAAYNRGPFGFNAIINVNPQALAKAREADKRRAEGDTSPLLGIPIVVKDIFDTDEMPTTGGSLAFENYRPEHDSFVVARLKAAGAIILGTANLSEFAYSGTFSGSGFGQVWNAFDPSKSPTGSSGGSAVAVATSMAAAALGTQTGTSLWGPSSAASMVSLRGTDGLTSTQGVMPLNYIRDFAGAITRSIPDQALVLNAIAARNPDDPTQALEGPGWEGNRPTDWQSHLKADALQGKTIGYYTAAFVNPFGDEGTTQAMREQFKYFEQAGATVKQIPAPAPAPLESNYFTGDPEYHGWLKWIQGHPNSPYTDPVEIMFNQRKSPMFRPSPTATYTGPGAMTETQIKGYVEYRRVYQEQLGDWMDDNGVDAVLFPGESSTIHLNDSIEPSFGRFNPQSSIAGVPTAIFPAGEDPDGQPNNLQLQGRAYSDAEMLAMAYAFENVAHGGRETSYAPALKFSSDSVAFPTGLPPAPTASTRAPEVTAPDGAKAKTKPSARLVGKLKLRHGKLLATVACRGSAGTCLVLLQIGGSKTSPDMQLQVAIPAGKRKTVKVTPSQRLRRQLQENPQSKVQVRLLAPEGRGKRATVSSVVIG
jgi:amidase